MSRQKKTKLVHGVGRNDSDYVVNTTSPNGKQTMCPYYNTWSNMLSRAYSQKFHARQPTYIGVTVCEEWHSFMAFRSWMIKQDWEGKHLDKDIIVPGNKVYSPNRCAFVSRETNSLLNSLASARGELPIGVHWCSGKFRAAISENGKRVRLGHFTAPFAAHLAWREAKVKITRAAARDCDDPRVSSGLLRHSYRIESGLVA